MALNFKQALTFGLAGAAGVALAVVGGRNLMAARKVDSVQEEHDRKVRVHNLIHSEEYMISKQDFIKRFGDVFDYVHSYRYGRSVDTSKNEIVMSQFAMIIDEDVSMLLAAGLAAVHMFQDYADVFPDRPLVWNMSQTRYCTPQQFVGGKLDVAGLSFQPAELVDEATFIRQQINNHRELRVCAFIRDQATMINKIFDGDVVFGK